MPLKERWCFPNREPSKWRTSRFLDLSGAFPSMSLREMEKQHIQRVLEECGWNITRASKLLDINRVTLHKKIKRFDMQRNA